MKRESLLKMKAGFSMAELMIAVAILGGLSLVFMNMIKSQHTDSVEYQVHVAKLDLENQVIEAFNDGSICTFILTDASQATNRSNNIFDASALSEASPSIITIKNIPIKPSAASALFATVGKPASLLTNKLLINDMRFHIRPNRPPDLFLADFEIELNQPLVRKIGNIVIKDIQIVADSTTPTNAKKIESCGNAGYIQAQRITFTEDSNWVVPVGVRRAFVTMAGGGGSGLGWRVISSLTTGHSGGYVFSQPINLTPGEVIQIIVGKGGKGYGPYSTGVPASPGPPYFIYTRPASDDGLGGYPGTSSKIISPTYGTLLECAGGSGASIGGVDNYSGSVVAGDLPGATNGSGTPPLPSANRPADGPYATSNGPGSCGPGPAGYGTGNRGISIWGLHSGAKPGGSTPFGYGSGGDVAVSGCYVNFTTVGTCIFPLDGRDGIVYIDVW